MGYESKIIIVDRSECEMPNGKTWVYGDEIARFDLSKMGNELVNGKLFRNVFHTPVDFNLYVNNEDPNVSYSESYWREDMYGAVCKWASVDEVMSWLKNSETAQTYRRAKLFFDFLRVLKMHESEYGQICVVHYGY